MSKPIIRFVTASFLGLVLAGAADAQRVGWHVVEVYSNADASSQFVQVCGGFGGGEGDQPLAGRTLIASNGSTTRSFDFPSNLPGDSACFLVGTQGFADLNLVKPDYVVPNGYLFVPDGSVSLANFDTIKYAGLPTDGFQAIGTDTDERPVNGHPSTYIVSATATNFAGVSYTFGKAPPRTNFGGLWWNAPAGSESGWGVAVEHQGDNVFAALATYDETGSPVWFVMPNPTLYVPGIMDDIWPDTTWQGTIYQMSGPSFGAVAFDPSKVTATSVGGGGFHFPRAVDNGIGTLYWGIYGTGPYGPYKSITRLVFADPVPVCVDGGTPGVVPNYQGLWWNPAESGWGLYLAHQGNVIFGVWFTYDTAGKATWFTLAATPTAPNTYAGSIVRNTGPSYRRASFDGSAVTETVVGEGTLTFNDRDNGAFSYNVNGISQTESITRQIFASPPTVCN